MDCFPFYVNKSKQVAVISKYTVGARTILHLFSPGLFTSLGAYCDDASHITQHY